MKWLHTVLREIYGLFVDDLWFTASLLAWLGVVWIGVIELPRVGAPSWLPPALFFLGLAGILLESALRFARRHARVS